MIIKPFNIEIVGYAYLRAFENFEMGTFSREGYIFRYLDRTPLLNIFQVHPPPQAIHLT